MSGESHHSAPPINTLPLSFFFKPRLLLLRHKFKYIKFVKPEKEPVDIDPILFSLNHKERNEVKPEKVWFVIF